MQLTLCHHVIFHRVIFFSPSKHFYAVPGSSEREKAERRGAQLLLQLLQTRAKPEPYTRYHHLHAGLSQINVYEYNALLLVCRPLECTLLRTGTNPFTSICMGFGCGEFQGLVRLSISAFFMFLT